MEFKMGLRRRRISSADASEESPSLISANPIVSITSKVALARIKKGESRFSIIVQITLIIVGFSLLYYTVYHFDHFHYNLVYIYASKFDDHHAQHQLGHKLLKEGTNHTGAFHWFRKSADKGHPESAYNLAAGHLSGFKTDVEKGETKKLLEFAAKNGVKEAEELLERLCPHSPSYCEN